ncbi:MAG: phosphoglycerate dehydrogenase-like enzyme [Desulforhopalus sp.]|jgi:phosphoglycerate dehydrogenase-like enzyme
MTEQKNNRLLILSHNAHKYAKLIADAGVPDLQITPTVTVEKARAFANQQNILLAPPDLAYEILPAMTNLQWMQSTWAGVNKLLEEGCRKDYLLTGVKGVFGPIMSEYVFCYILMHARKALQCYALQKDRKWEMPMPGLLRGKKIGIMGVGSIGIAIAQTAKHFNMITYGYSRSATLKPEIDRMFKPDNILNFVGDLDYLVTVLPQTLNTNSLINSTILKAMKTDALLINVGRGNVLDERALIEALNSQEIAGAVLDVFQQEPLPDTHPLWNTRGAIITSHKSALTYPEDIAPIFINNYKRFIARQNLQFCIDFERGY